ncbi:MAG: DUF3566 domain-containing protein [Candidatus Nanopelagicales bacterium]
MGDEHPQGQPGPDRKVGRPGPAARMVAPTPTRPRPSVLIEPVHSTLAAESAPHPADGVSGDSASMKPATTTSAPSVTADVNDGRVRPSAADVARSAVEPVGGARSARVFLTHVDPWSVMKQSFLLGMALAVIIVVAAASLWFALDSAGVLDAITRTATDVGGDSGASVGNYLSLSRVMGASLVLAGIETVLMTVLATLFAFLYNLAVGIGGGLEVTLSEDY